ncbi:pirin family protein [Jiulongibacter sediminis]|jgi:redox-sensitive bicupin YhaK (pirin superfamily)|uniref:pirin family protein n=1 Tax=Jiulongibacter sediminis TaxID=1605367 RepID=UPI0026F15FBC|nr:pirin family protein [Jiulongibacter sediminis]
MTKTIYRAKDRGHANHGWLDTYHTFSFAGYYNPDRIHFGALRVLNDDTVSGGMGFGTHPHDNMEIVSIPLEGALEHKDTMGNTTVIKKGEVQIMSAGTGVQHSEKNHSSQDTVKFLQIWVFPEERGLEPRYEQKLFNEEDRLNQWQTVVSPMDSIDPGVKINQNSWFSMTKLEEGRSLTYQLKNNKNGVFIFNLSGSAKVADEILENRDGIGIKDINKIEVNATIDAELLVMEVPMFA